LTTCYLDASAIVKLATLEPETDALREQLGRYDNRITSRIATVEVPRALARRGAESVAVGSEPIREVLMNLQLVELDESIAAGAAELGPPGLRSLDAIHLASALAIGEELTALVTYDARLALAARAAGLIVMAPA
jgi:predicted nucleic acid-binding protein